MSNAGTAPARAVLKPNSAELQDPAYRKVRDLIYQTSGIHLSDEKIYVLASRVNRRMKCLNISSPSEYVGYLTGNVNREAELRLLLNEITVGETCMFRSPQQLQALRSVVLPQMIEAKGALGFKRLHIWSAGCSTGEEPYTLAMVLQEESKGLLDGWTFDVIATDINEASLDAAKAGIYDEYALRGTSQELRRKYFQKYDEKRLQVTDEIKSLVHFERVNLNDDSRMMFLKGMDLIFCCNVLIYFNLASKRKVMQHFFANLLPGGYLFLGNAESLYQVDDRFQVAQLPGVIGYWKPSLVRSVGSARR